MYIYIYNDEFYYYYYYESYYLIVVNVIIACDIVILLWSLSLLLLLYIIYTTRMGNRHSSVCGYAYIYILCILHLYMILRAQPPRLVGHDMNIHKVYISSKISTH